jgi:tetratricopeptide (TPR) repeat protein
MVEQLFDGLESEQQRTLEAASVVGRDFSVAAAAAGTDEAQRLVEDRCAALARSGQFLVAAGTEAWPDGTIAERYRFVHALYQHVVYERLSPGRRSQLHARIGARAEAGYRERAAERAAELARHFREARDARRAVTYLRQAADNALQRSAHHEAAAHLLQALAVLEELPRTPERDRDELAVLIALGPLLMSTKGYAAADVAQAYIRAQTLSREVGEHALLVRATWGLAMHHLVRGQPRKAHDGAQELLGLIDDAGNAPLRALAHATLGQALYYLGELSLARTHCQQGIEVFPKDGLSGTQNDPRVGCICYGAWAAWAQGYPDQALTACREATRLVQDRAQSSALAAAEVFTARLHQFRREPDLTRRHAEAAMKLSREHGFTQRLAAATILLGWAEAIEGAPDGIETMVRGLDDYRATGAGDDLSYWLALLAERRAAVGQADAALRDLGEAQALVAAGGPAVWEAELHRLKGVLVSRLDNNEAEAAFEAALAIARRQEARTFELRAATSLARWRRDQGRQTEARAVLASARARFTEGSDTSDLIDADVLLRELGATVPAPSS